MTPSQASQKRFWGGPQTDSGQVEARLDGGFREGLGREVRPAGLALRAGRAGRLRRMAGGGGRPHPFRHRRPARRRRRSLPHSGPRAGGPLVSMEGRPSPGRPRRGRSLVQGDRRAHCRLVRTAAEEGLGRPVDHPPGRQGADARTLRGAAEQARGVLGAGPRPAGASRGRSGLPRL